MLIPDGPAGSPAEGFPTLYVSRLRTYGAAGFRMDDQEALQGCPRLYKAKYVENRVVIRQQRSEPMSKGRAVHDALHLMETEAIGPEDALERVWPVDLDPSHWREVKEMLAKYMERGGPMNKYATLATELHLFAELYVDEEYGPVYFGGIIDWLGVDVDQPHIMHVVDYKTNQQVPHVEDVKGDIQLKAYDWLVRQNWQRLGLMGRPQVVVHLDAVRWKDVEWRFDASDLEEWREWASAIARQILRDQAAREVLNPGCAWCPIKLDCSAYKALPGQGLTLAERSQATALPELWKWREEAAETVKMLKAGIDQIDATVREKVEAEGELVLGGHRWTMEDDWGTVLDKTRLFRLIGAERFVQLAGVTKKACDEFVRRLQDEDLATAVRACWSREPGGRKLKKEKVKGDGAAAVQ